MGTKQELGKMGEGWAARFLKEKGFRIVDCNFRTRWGEIDIVARKRKEYFFVEVKTRQSLDYGHPLESLPPYRVARLEKMAQFYALRRRLLDRPLHLSLLGIDLSGPSPRIDFIPYIID